MSSHPTTATPAVSRPTDLGEALELLAADGAEALAGGTWIMRSPVRGEGFSSSYVLTSHLAELDRLEFVDDRLIIGAGVTHDRLARFLAGDDRYVGLRTAAAKSANPAIRRMATVGGNLSTHDFPAADLVPALLAADAIVRVANASGMRELPIEEFVAVRGSAPRPLLIVDVSIPVTGAERHSMHERLTMRRAGDYPIAIVHLSAVLAADGTVKEMRAAIGSVERVPRRWHALEDRLRGGALDPEAAAAAAVELGAELDPRDAVEAEGWYRIQVLPALVKNAARALAKKGTQR